MVESREDVEWAAERCEGLAVEVASRSFLSILIFYAARDLILFSFLRAWW